MSLNKNNFDREQVRAELEQCQERIIQTLVPTLIAVGLISIADRENIALITLCSSFAVLYGSSLYVASLSYKIFRNTTFIQALNERNSSDSDIYWWGALSRYNQLYSPPLVIGYETTTISVVYFVFSIAFVIMFYEIQLLLSLALGFLLASVAIRIFIIPREAKNQLSAWRTVFKEIDDGDK